MNDIEERILSYPHLSDEEQQEIEAYVEVHPKWAALLRDVRSIEDLSAARQSDLPSDALLATYVTIQYVHGGSVEHLSSQMQAAFSALDARITNDEALRREAEAARRRLKEAEAAVDPVAHFEALTEHTLDEAPAPDETTPAASEQREPRRSSSPSLWTVVLNLPRLVRRGAVAVLLLGVVYGGLYGVSRATQSPLDRLAVMDVSAQVVENYAAADLRSPVPSSDTATVDDQYLEALSILQEAKRSPLGLFPHYDLDRLAQAEQRLDAVLNQVEPGSFLAREAHFYLGKIALAQDDVDAARHHLKIVVRQEGRRAPEASSILTTLQQEYGGGGND